ncbi:tachykinin-4 isoform X15 [Phyllostomus discolor]|uniref:Tachykinin-4 isoform X15 n=1 Tax=Phyllostomus discolor TaxID=89673 RepID=A0A7E6EDM2_9CHIR|nr:tachykinin-4 isoform X15 [Phyllostomus discolor]
MLLCRALLLLLGLSACAVAGDEEPALSGTEARSWLTVTLEGCLLSSQQEQMAGHQRGQMGQDLPGRRGPSTEERVRSAGWSESPHRMLPGG